MQYALLDLHAGADRGRRRRRRSRPRWRRTTPSAQHLRDRGAMLGGEALDSIATATTVRVVDGRTITTDGPFAETKETLGGFYLVEAADLDEAIAYAAMIPGARHGCIEVRPGLGLRVDRRGRRAGRGDGRELTLDRPRRPRRRLTGSRRRPRRSSIACSARSRAGRSRRSSG